jgi:hypothetical protein
MATLSELVAAGDLHKYDPELPPNEFELRTFLGSDRVAKWAVKELPALARDLDSELTPEQAFSALMETFCGGTELEIPKDFHPMRPVGKGKNEQGIWELRTRDLRIFGWFPVRDVFVAVSAHTAKKVKDLDIYPGLVLEAVSFRDKLDLDEPKFIKGDDPNAVVSNSTYTA